MLDRKGNTVTEIQVVNHEPSISSKSWTKYLHPPRLTRARDPGQDDSSKRALAESQSSRPKATDWSKCTICLSSEQTAENGCLQYAYRRRPEASPRHEAPSPPAPSTEIPLKLRLRWASAGKLSCKALCILLTCMSFDSLIQILETIKTRAIVVTWFFACFTSDLWGHHATSNGQSLARHVTAVIRAQVRGCAWSTHLHYCVSIECIHM